MKFLLRLAVLPLAAAIPVFAQFHLPGTGGKSDAPGKPKNPAATAPPAAPDTPSRFDYYVLALTWAPGNGAQFAVRALLPEAREGVAPESCSSVKTISKGAMNLALSLMPSRAVIQQEWAKHGSCTGLSAMDYFNGIRYARSQVQIPVQFTSLEEATTETPLQIESTFGGANPGFPPGAFRTGCTDGAFTEVRVCFDLHFKPRECMASANECPVSELAIRPPR
jgi:ribonuclease T2